MAASPLQDSLILAYCRVWPAGLSPKAPGTCGSLVAILLAPWVFMPLPLWGRVLLLLAVFLSGVWASSRAIVLLGHKDPSEVVIDEVLGQWLTCLPFLTLSFWGYAAALFFFRLFDIIKPWYVGRAEKLPGGLGIMADDAVAGVYAMACLWGFLALTGL